MLAVRKHCFPPDSFSLENKHIYIKLWPLYFPSQQLPRIDIQTVLLSVCHKLTLPQYQMEKINMATAFRMNHFQNKTMLT